MVNYCCKKNTSERTHKRKSAGTNTRTKVKESGIASSKTELYTSFGQAVGKMFILCGPICNLVG